jgi:ligand-binding sensor domain-containing protein
MKQIFLLHFLLVVISSCKGQNKPAQKKAELRTSVLSNHVNEGNSKIIRTQGTVSGTVNCQLQDKDGNLWFSIDGEGAYRFDGKSFTNFTTRNGLSSNNVGPVIQDNTGNILFGTSRGICKYDGKTFTKYLETDSLSITCLLEAVDGSLWFGTRGNGVYRYKEKKLTNFLNNDDHPFNLGVHYQLILDILQDKKGNLWFCSWNGGGVWRYDGKSFKNFLPSEDYYKTKEDERFSTNIEKQPSINFLPKTLSYAQQDHITDDMIFSIAEDRAGNLWFATRRHGACRYDGKLFASFRENEGFVSYGVYAILQDEKGNFWFTTDKNGVFYYDGKTFKNFTTNDGLINNSVLSILEEKNGNIWFGTKWFGLSSYDGKKIITFSGYEFK